MVERDESTENTFIIKTFNHYSRSLGVGVGNVLHFYFWLFHFFIHVVGAMWGLKIKWNARLNCNKVIK